MPPRRRLIALLLAGSVAIGLAIGARRVWGPDRYHSLTRPQLEAVLARRPNDAAALHQLGLCYLAEQRVPEARQTLERALSAAPGSARIANTLGEVCVRQRDFAAARGYFEQATQLDPGLAIAHRNLGDAWGVAGNFVQAAQEYQRALALEPRDASTLAALGSTYADAGNSGRAIATFQQAIALAPRSAEAYQGLGRAFLKFHRYREAREALRRAADLDPSDAHTAAFLGLAYAEAIQSPEDAREAVRQFDRAVALGYQAAEGHYGRGLVHLYLKQYDLAIHELQSATHADPGAENMAYQLAQAYLAAGRRAEGERELAQFDRLVRARPELRRLRQVVEAQPEDAASRLRLARLCLDTGRSSEALHHFLQLARRQPRDPAVLNGLAAAATAMGNADLAAQARAALAATRAGKQGGDPLAVPGPAPSMP
jgi:tetratricopeptide (TPR) repeat protein